MSEPQDWLWTLGLLATTLVGAVGCCVSFAQLVREKPSAATDRLATTAMVLLATGVFLYRALAVHEAWTPLENHADGLTLLVVMLGVFALYLEWTRSLPGVGAFALALATVMSLWAFCASWFTLRPFSIGGVWKQVHLFAVYSGTFGVALAGGAGVMWLYVDQQLRRKDHRAQRLRTLGKLGNLESLESAVTRSATLGFALLTIGLASGVVVVSSESSRLGDGWWYSPKVLLAAVSWAIYALLMNVRHVATFRGRRAAVLAIVGFILFLAVLGIAQTLPAAGDITLESETDPSSPTTRPSSPSPEAN